MEPRRCKSLCCPKAATRVYPLVVVTSQPSVQNDRPKLDVEPFVKSGDHTAAGRDRELRALSRLPRSQSH